MTLTDTVHDDRPTLAQKIANRTGHSVLVIQLTRPYDESIVNTALAAAGARLIGSAHPDTTP